LSFVVTGGQSRDAIARSGSEHVKVLKSFEQIGHRKLVNVDGAAGSAAAAGPGAKGNPARNGPPATATPARLRKFLRLSPPPSFLLSTSLGINRPSLIAVYVGKSDDISIPTGIMSAVILIITVSFMAE
jgi:hypothetical protein